MIKAINREAKYRLDFNAPGASDPVPPSSGVFQTLAGALIAGWEINVSGGRSLGVTYGGLPVMREDDLGRAFERLHAIEGECSDGNKMGCAEQVLRELGLELSSLSRRAPYLNRGQERNGRGADRPSHVRKATSCSVGLRIE